MKHTILCVDDEVDNVEALERLFRKKYSVLTATSAKEGLEIIKKNRVALIISDQRMPGRTGVELLKDSMEYVPEAIRILLTGYTDIGSVVDAINKGEVYRYISKPWDPVDLVNTVDKAIEKYELSAELQIKNAELKRALDELKVLDEAKTKFMILINHELKTPLTVILSFLELLTETELSEEQKSYVSRIKGSGDRLKKIIEDVLSFVSAETGLLKVSRKKITTDKFLNDLAEKYKLAANKKKQTFKIKSKSDTFKADPEVIRNVTEHLIENAIKFGAQNSEIELIVDLSGDATQLAVTNEGKAVPNKIIESIQKPFNLDEDIMKHSDGLGLGLSVSQALLRAHDSKLEFDHHAGRTQVQFKLNS